jgi:hypothetical protein
MYCCINQVCYFNYLQCLSMIPLVWLESREVKKRELSTRGVNMCLMPLQVGDDKSNIRCGLRTDVLRGIEGWTLSSRHLLWLEGE